MECGAEHLVDGSLQTGLRHGITQGGSAQFLILACDEALISSVSNLHFKLQPVSWLQIFPYLREWNSAGQETLRNQHSRPPAVLIKIAPCKGFVVSLQAAVAHLGKAERPLEHVERLLDFGLTQALDSAPPRHATPGCISVQRVLLLTVKCSGRAGLRNPKTRTGESTISHLRIAIRKQRIHLVPLAYDITRPHAVRAV